MTQLGMDSYWLGAKNFIQQHLQEGDRLIGPAAFKELFPNTYTYNQTYKENIDRFNWIIIHKGVLERINRTFLEKAASQLTPVFANEVFIIFSSYANAHNGKINPQ